jgi:D-3-phosphoglycerate dehydrogenase
MWGDYTQHCYYAAAGDVVVFDVLTLNAISPRGLARLPRERYRVSSDSATPDAILVRSFNLHDREIPTSVRAIGRAGAGVNNIPVAAMSQRGIPVFNAPGANANAVKELVVAGLIIGCRHLCHAWDFARTLAGDDASLHKAVEAGKKQFVGTEISGRTLGVIGLGAIGRNVATAASALGMHVVGFDPALTVERAARLASAVRRVETLDELLAVAEFLTVHVPLIDDTRNLISTDQIARMPSKAVILNFAREGIVDERAVVTALDAGRLSAYVSDFPTNPHVHAPALRDVSASGCVDRRGRRELRDHGRRRDSRLSGARPHPQLREFSGGGVGARHAVSPDLCDVEPVERRLANLRNDPRRRPHHCGHGQRLAR